MLTPWQKMRWNIGSVPKTSFPPAAPRPVPLAPSRPVVSGGGVAVRPGVMGPGGRMVVIPAKR